MMPFISDGYKKSTQDVISPIQRFQYWSDLVCEEFVQLDCSGPRNQSFTGELRGGIGLDDLKFSEVKAGPHVVERSRRQISRATESEFLISFQLSNRCSIRQSGREAILTPGTFVLYDSTQPYTFSFKEEFHQFVIQLPTDILKRHLMEPERFIAISMSGKSGLGAVLTNFVLSLARESKALKKAPAELSDNLTNMIAMAFSSSVMLEHLSENTIVQNNLINRVNRYIEMNLPNPGLSNQAIADAQGISTRYLNKLFEKKHQSVHQVVMEKRLCRAMDMLQSPSYQGHSIESIAYNVGFSSAAYFSRCFKQRFGSNPSQHRGV